MTQMDKLDILLDYKKEIERIEGILYNLSNVEENDYLCFTILKEKENGIYSESFFRQKYTRTEQNFMVFKNEIKKPLIDFYESKIKMLKKQINKILRERKKS